MNAPTMSAAVDASGTRLLIASAAAKWAAVTASAPVHERH
jgi:hypothetical protein